MLRPVDGTPARAWRRSPDRHVLSVTYPIDVVYTWVDGSDPAWSRRKAAAQHEHLTAGRSSTSWRPTSSRFTTRDELRYSLRSLDMYADWVRHVYLVTDDQVPDWLDTDEPADHAWSATGSCSATAGGCPPSTRTPSRASCTTSTG